MIYGLLLFNGLSIGLFLGMFFVKNWNEKVIKQQKEDIDFLNYWLKEKKETIDKLVEKQLCLEEELKELKEEKHKK